MLPGEPPVPRIAGLRRLPRRRVEITLDDGRVFVFGREACERAALREGVLAAPELLEHLDREDRHLQAHERALNLLSYRQRTEAELRRRLGERADETTVEGEITRLKAAGLIDDGRFASQWVEERQARSPRSGRLLRQELRAKGIGGELAFEATGDLDDAEAAYAFAAARARKFSGDFGQFCARTAAALQRRGFGYATAEAAVRRAWQESHAGDEAGD